MNMNEMTFFLDHFWETCLVGAFELNDLQSNNVMRLNSETFRQIFDAICVYSETKAEDALPKKG